MENALARMTSPVKILSPEFALDTRSGWPADLRLLLDRYPREVWEGHANLGAMAQFWLQRHAMFREIAAALEQATAAFRDGTAAAQDLRAWFPSRLQFFLQQLNAHHQIEDLHYFPVFQAAEARLAHGFDVLEIDHKVIHEQIDATVEAANVFLRVAVNADALRGAGERYAAQNDALLRLLAQHLADEEDLIIPLILDRSEAALGVG
jgi:hemerythrin-like domain-containing protein